MKGPVEVLLVDDDPDDVFLAEKAFGILGALHRFHCASTGEEALELLRNAGKPGGIPLPDLALFDLNLPRMSGSELLAAVRRDPRWRRLPIVMLTGSPVDQQCLEGEDPRVTCYLSKPDRMRAYYAAARRIEAFRRAAAKEPRSPEVAR